MLSKKKNNSDCNQSNLDDSIGVEGEQIGADGEWIGGEKKLVKDLKKGNSGAVRYWYKKYYSQLVLIANQKIELEADVQDVVQETMINVLRQIQLFRGESALKTWMISILRHEIADYYRKKYAKRTIQTVSLGKKLFNKPIQDTQVVDRQVRNVLKKIENSKKRLLLMKYVDGLKVREIADKLDRTYKSVEAELYRARQLFIKLYKKGREKERECLLARESLR